ncbi:hypothetical protein TRVL_09072 [Trypanosoma vivax]|nr:hypothetical protein TRVL_09072 [Trypanosoma vivax]
MFIILYPPCFVAVESSPYFFVEYAMKPALSCYCATPSVNIFFHRILMDPLDSTQLHIIQLNLERFYTLSCLILESVFSHTLSFHSGFLLHYDLCVPYRHGCILFLHLISNNTPPNKSIPYQNALCAFVDVLLQ